MSETTFRLRVAISKHRGARCNLEGYALCAQCCRRRLLSRRTTMNCYEKCLDGYVLVCSALFGTRYPIPTMQRRFFFTQMSFLLSAIVMVRPNHGLTRSEG